MKKFEYKAVKFKGDEPALADMLNANGEVGWELIHIQETAGMLLFFFKKEI